MELDILMALRHALDIAIEQSEENVLRHSDEVPR